MIIFRFSDQETREMIFFLRATWLLDQKNARNGQKSPFMAIFWTKWAFPENSGVMEKICDRFLIQRPRKHLKDAVHGSVMALA